MADDIDNAPRRNFLKGGALASAAALARPIAGAANPPAPDAAPKVLANVNSAAESLPPKDDDPVTQTSSGAEYMVEVIKSIGVDYAAINPASSYRGLHEALINYGGNSQPELLTCMHEEIAVAIAHGYAKISGKPMLCLAHGVVGLQHAAMALYNAYCDRVPVVMMVGNILAAEKRGLPAEWQHSAIDPGALVRDFVKWDDQPGSLTHYGESTVRAFELATLPPMGPVLLSLDTELQENPIPEGRKPPVPRYHKTIPPIGDGNAVDEAARMLVEAESPVILADRLARTQAGMDRLVELAELLQCGVVSQLGRTNFPTQHPLNAGRASVGNADVILGLELNDYWATVNAYTDRIERRSRSITRDGAKTISIGTRDLGIRANFQEFARFMDVNLPIAGDGEETLPSLIEAVRRRLSTARKSALEARGRMLAQERAAGHERMRHAASIGWDNSPISTGRLCAELYAQISNDDWSLVGEALMTPWARQLWTADKVYRFNGYSGGWGIGYTGPGALGGALANRAHGRLSVAMQGDGDFNFCPSTLWTAAHHRIPILWIIHNNRAYHQEVMYLQDMCNRMNRGIRNAHLGTGIDNPDVNYAQIARGYGVHGEGPISDPRMLAPALKRALDVVRRGEPALVDVVMEPR